MNDPSETVLNRVQHRYWVTKQAVLKKLGKKEDEFIVSSDAELDAKLELFKSVQETTSALLTVINQYHQNVNNLALEESEMGYFMKGSGKQDKSRAGKMMVAVGTSVLYSGQQRFLLQRPLDRFYQKLETFQRRAIADTLEIIQCMEKARTEYRASLNWLKDISQELNPDTYRQMERFKKVQEHVKKSKKQFDHLKNICITKIDVLVASRSNMFSSLLVNYERSFLEFTDKCVNTFTVIANSFKGYEHYDFCVVKELSDLKPDSSIVNQHQQNANMLNEGEISSSSVSTEQEGNKKEASHEAEESDLLSMFESSSAALSTTAVSSTSLQPPNDSDDLLLFPSASDQQMTTETPQRSTSEPATNLFLPSHLLNLQNDGQNELSAALSNKKMVDNKPNAWYSLFAELDPLSDPDSIMSRTDDTQQQRKC